ncbi:hypothetical protein H4R18_004877 [Coemansia javaensis]|uniref:HSF-type DNA-binding domain-containing protein n=1 Tax=Coemansia javaensis TaxID=2761396 RepID=A0A9W8H4Y4_9FUNG|nr:hypothetical protein H4R18_004877 [Coemansia javaensis]
MPVLRFVEAVALDRPADQGVLQPDATAAQPPGPLAAAYADAAAAWPPHAPAIEKIQPDPAAAAAAAAVVAATAGGYADGPLAGDVSIASYPTPSQPLGPSPAAIGHGYPNPGAMFATTSLPMLDGGSSVAAIPADLAATLPPASQFQAFSGIAPTPVELNDSSNSSPRAGLLSHVSASPGSIHSAPLYPRPDAMGPGMQRPTLLPLDIHPHAAMTGFDDLPASAPGVRVSLPHTGSLSAGVHGSGMRSTDSDNSVPSTARTSSGFGLAGRPSSSGGRNENLLFPVLLHRICEDPLMDDIAYWDASNFVCIPSMEQLRLKLNALGMTANQDDSLQKNFNDYQFKRQTDQRRIRHTNERAIIKFSNENFLPGREDLVHRISRKSAVKKQQNSGARDRAAAAAAGGGGGGSASGTRRKARVPSLRQGASRGQRQPAADRANPYARPLTAEQSPVSGFPMPMSPVHPFPPHQGPGSASVPPLYSSSEVPGVLMPFNVSGLEFGAPHAVSIADRADPVLMATTAASAAAAAYSHAPLYNMDGSPSLVVHGLMHQPGMGLPPQFHGPYSGSIPQQQHHHHQQQQQQHHYHMAHVPQYSHHEHSPHQMPMLAGGGDQHHPHASFALPPLLPHPQQQQQQQQQPAQHHQYQVFASPGDMHSSLTPPNGPSTESHHSA